MEFLDKNGLKVFIEQLKNYMNNGLSDKEQTIEQNVTTAIDKNVENKINDRLKLVTGIDNLDNFFSTGGDLYRIPSIKSGLDDLESEIKTNKTDIKTLKDQLNKLSVDNFVNINDFQHVIGTDDLIGVYGADLSVQTAFEITENKLNEIFRVLGTDDLIGVYGIDTDIQNAFDLTENKLNNLKYKSFVFETDELNISKSDMAEIIENNIKWLIINGSWVRVTTPNSLWGSFCVTTLDGKTIFYSGSQMISPPGDDHPNDYRIINDTGIELNINNKFQPKLTNSTKLATINGVNINYNGNTVVGPTKSEFDELSKRVNISVPYLMLFDFDIYNTDIIDIGFEENTFIPSSYNAFRNDITPGSIIIDTDTHKGMLTWHGMINEENDNIDWFAEGSVYAKQNTSINYSDVTYLRMSGILTESYMTIIFQSTGDFNVNA